MATRWLSWLLLGAVISAAWVRVTPARAEGGCRLECNPGCVMIGCDEHAEVPELPGDEGGGGGGNGGPEGDHQPGGGPWGGAGLCYTYRCMLTRDNVCRIDTDPQGRPSPFYGAADVTIVSLCSDPINQVVDIRPHNTCCQLAEPTPTPVTKLPSAPCVQNPAYFNVGDGWIRHVIDNKCYKDFGLEATAYAPPVEVLYNPGPRAMVAVETEFRADRDLSAPDYAWSGTVEDFDPGAWTVKDHSRSWDVKAGSGCPQPTQRVEHAPYYFDFKIGVRLLRVGPDTQLDDRPPCWVTWNWDERDWGRPQSTCGDEKMGTLAYHTWLTSSAGKPQNGMGLDGIANLPAYQVGVETYWAPQARWEWKHWECTSHDTCTYTTTHDCHCKHDEAGNKECDTCTEEHTSTVCSKVEVVQEHREFMPDLRNPEWCGLDHMYLKSPFVKTPDGRVLTALPVPVIEVQGVIHQ
jgi:hypothetical protein